MIKPYDWQQPEVDHLVSVLRQHNAALCGSDTGIGKTIIGLQVSKDLGLKPLIVCPKAVIPAWKQAAEDMGIEIIDVLNIEKLKTGKTKYLTKIHKTKYEWNLDPDNMLIVDEVHRFAGQKSQNSYVLSYAKAYNLKVLMLSATAADSPVKMRAIGYLLGLHNFREFRSWALKHGCYINQWHQLDFKGAKRYMEKLHNEIYPEKGHRLSVAEVPSFPETSIFPEAYDLGKYTKELDKIYDEMSMDLQDLPADTNPLTVMLRARQRSELLKVPLLKDMIVDALDEGKSPVVFVNFKETLTSLCESLNRAHEFSDDRSMIYGGQKDEDRKRDIQRFQDDETRICLCMIQAGGVGVSLDDRHGVHPRVAFITPNFSAVEMKQALGRIHRASSKSKSIQYILFASGTIEEDACKAIRRKLNNISLLNDGDLSSGLL